MKGIRNLMLLLGLFPALLRAQPADTGYIADYSRELVLRAYGSNKFTRLSFGERRTRQEVRYKPNSNYNIGLGLNYRMLAVNIGFKAPFVNDDDARRGRTHYLDMQAYLYMRRFTFDLYAQDYEGYYLANKEVLRHPPAGKATLIRSDLQTRNLGMNAEYIFNHDRFSYRATFLQNERQKKSAGSLIAGGGLHYLNVRGDSAILPEQLIYTDFFDNHPFDDFSAVSLSAHIGYAYTLVLKQRFFLTAGLMAGGGTSYTLLIDNGSGRRHERWGLSGNAIGRLGAGYNTDRYYVGLYFVTNVLRNSMPIPNAWEQYETGMLRLSVAKRIAVRPKAAEKIRRVERSLLLRRDRNDS